jgi:hypothetical protein
MPYLPDDPVERERRRWMRENAHLYIRPDAHRFVRPDAHRFLRPDAPGWKHPDHKLRNPYFRYRDRQTDKVRAAPAIPERRALECAWPVRAHTTSGPSDSEILKLKSDLAALRVQLAVIKHETATRKARGLPPLTEADEDWQIILRGLARFQDACRKAGLQNVDGKAGFNPAQPRVPAGNPDGGQWTSDGSAIGSNAGVGRGTGSGRGNGTGGGITDPRVLSDATPDNDWIPGARYAQDMSGRYSVNLLEEEAAGGHTFREHVSKSDEYLLQRARDMQSDARTDYEQYRKFPRDAIRAGSFSSLQSATNLVNSTLAQKKNTVDLVASGVSPAAALHAAFNSITGKEAFVDSLYSAPMIRETYGVRVYILRDAASPRGYRVHTAYPTRY